MDTKCPVNSKKICNSFWPIIKKLLDWVFLTLLSEFILCNDPKLWWIRYIFLLAQSCHPDLDGLVIGDLSKWRRSIDQQIEKTSTLRPSRSIKTFHILTHWPDCSYGIILSMVWYEASLLNTITGKNFWNWFDRICFWLEESGSSMNGGHHIIWWCTVKWT